MKRRIHQGCRRRSARVAAHGGQRARGAMAAVKNNSLRPERPHPQLKRDPVM